MSRFVFEVNSGSIYVKEYSATVGGTDLLLLASRFNIT